MTHLALSRWPKTNNHPTVKVESHVIRRENTNKDDDSFSTSSRTENSTDSSSSSSSSSCGLSKLMRRLKKHRMLLHRPSASASRQSSFQCRYDPLSYSLNFDTSGCSADEDHYKICAFSSRFVAAPKTSDCLMLVSTSH